MTKSLEEFQSFVETQYSDFIKIFSSKSSMEVCDQDYISFLNKAENEGSPFLLMDAEEFLR